MTERVRHIKRGTTYKVIARGLLQWSGENTIGPVIENTPMVVYQSEQDGKVWVRPQAQFDDPKRFEVLP